MSLVFLCSAAFAQESNPKTAKECLERFSATYQQVSKSYGVAGAITSKSLAMPGLSQSSDWFAFEHSESRSKRQFYSEASKSSGEASGPWQRLFLSDNRVWVSVGKYSDPFVEAERKENEDDLAFSMRFSEGCPSLYALAILSPTESQLSSNGKHLVSVLDEMKVIDERRVGNDVVGSFYASNFVSIITFGHSSGYMPEKCETYFYQSIGEDLPKPSEYTILWHEGTAKWKKLDAGVWVPVEVLSTKHRNQRNSKKLSAKVEATATWRVPIDKGLFSGEHVNRIPFDEPTNKLRTELQDESEGDSVR